MEVIFRNIAPRLENKKNLNCFQFVIDTFYKDNHIQAVQFPVCHNIKLKLVKRFVRFRLKIFCVKMKKNMSLKFGHAMASKTSAMHALAQNVR